MFRRPATLTAAAVISLAAAACSSSSPSNSSPRPAAVATAHRDAAGAQEITVRGTDSFRFEPGTIRARVGTVRVTLATNGSYPHNLAIDSLHRTSTTVSGNPGERSTTFSLTFVRPGTYDFECTYHSSAGMRGRFIISG